MVRRAPGGDTDSGSRPGVFGQGHGPSPGNAVRGHRDANLVWRDRAAAENLYQGRAAQESEDEAQ